MKATLLWYYPNATLNDCCHVPYIPERSLHFFPLWQSFRSSDLSRIYDIENDV